MKEINLEEIIESHRNDTDHWADQDFDEYGIEQICLEFGKQLLELAAENAKLLAWRVNDNEELSQISLWSVNEDGYEIIPDKQSILDTIKQVE